MNCAINCSAPRTGRRCGPPNLFIAFSAAGCTAVFPYLAGDKFLSTFTKFQKSLLSSSFLPVCPSAWNNSTPTERIFIKFHVLDFSKLCRCNFNCFLSVHVDNYTIIIPTKCTRFLLLKSQDITICNFALYFCPYMFQPTWIIFRGLNASAWLMLLLITIY
jgi:hypothetical protein